MNCSSQNRFVQRNVNNYLLNFKIRNQILIIQVIFLIVFVGIFIALNYIHQKILSQKCLEELSKIFQQNSKKRTLLSHSIYENYIDQIFALNGNALITFHRLYLKTKNEVQLQSQEIDENYQMYYEGIQQIPDPVRILNEYGSNISNSFLCYSNTSSYDLPQNLEQRTGIKQQEQIQALGQILFQGSLIMQSNIYSYIEKQKINNIYPCVNRGHDIYNYEPQNRDWYKLLKQTYFNQSLYHKYQYRLTQPYQLFTLKKISLSMTLPIVDENLNFLGGVASTFQFATLLQYFQNNNTGFQIIYLVSEDGILIMHPFNISTKQPLYIYNETMTGFNKSDWQKILQKEDNQMCYNFDIDIDLFCIYNSVTQQQMIISIEKIKNQDMYLLILLSTNEFKFYNLGQQTQLEQELQTELYTSLIYILLIFVFSVFFIFILIEVIIYPLNQLVHQIKHFVDKQKIFKIKLPNFIGCFISQDISSLIKSIDQFIVAKNKFINNFKAEQIQQNRFYPLQNDNLYGQQQKDFKQQMKRMAYKYRLKDHIKEKIIIQDLFQNLFGNKKFTFQRR